jgi:hypothetical protein
VDNHLDLFCLVLQELAPAGLVRDEKADGARCAKEDTFSIPIVLTIA